VMSWQRVLPLLCKLIVLHHLSKLPLANEISSIESMKMETVIRSPQDGVIKKLAHKAGDVCKAGTVLVVFDEDGAAQ
jgi:acetyl/propionyl-CoA carboxylase alpha subunit